MPQIGQIFRLRRAFPPYKFSNKFPNTPKFFSLRRAFPLPNLSSESRALFCDSKGCPQMRLRHRISFFPACSGLVSHGPESLYNTIRTKFCGAFGTGKPYVWIFQSIWGPPFFPGLRPKFIDQKNLDGNKGEQSLRRRGR